MKNDPEDLALRQAHRAVLFVGAVFVLIALGYVSGHAALSVFFGAGIAAVNLWLLSKSVRNLISGQNTGWAAAAALKFVALLGIIYLLIDSGLVLPVGLAVGFGALPVGILLAGVFGSSSQSSALRAQRPESSETDHA